MTDQVATTGSPRVITLVAAASSALFALPVFLTGAVAVQVRDDFAFSAGALGLTIGLTRAVGAVTSVPLGRATDRLGAFRSIQVAALIVITACVGLATTANSWLTLTFWLVFSSTANSLGLPGLHRLLLHRVSTRRLGLAFGIKQSAPPLATMLAGLSVPAVALTVGWRWTFVIVAVWGAIVIPLVRWKAAPRRPSGTRASDDATVPAVLGREDRRTIMTLATAIGLAQAAATCFAAFYVSAAVDRGVGAEIAGFVLALASLGAVAVRITAGGIADRMHGGHLRVCALLVSVGAVGYVLLAVGRGGTAVNVAGALLAMSTGWGFNGVFWYSVTRAFSDHPGRITGLVRPGTLAGGGLGPVVFGLVIDRFSYTMGWVVALALALGGAAAMLAANRRLRVREGGAVDAHSETPT